MVLHTWNKLECFAVAFVVVFSFGIFIPFIIALSNGHVTPYVPYISEAGGIHPEAGVFSFLTAISTFICQWVMCLRYLFVEKTILRKPDTLLTKFNKLSFFLGAVSTFAMLLVTAYPTTTVSQVHNSAAGIACVCYILYQIVQTWISKRMLGKTKTSNFRLAVTVFSVLAVVLLAAFGLLGSRHWTANHWTGRKTPNDAGFLYYVISASAEWTLAILLMVYFLSYIPEFKKLSFKYQIEIIDETNTPPRLSNLDIRLA